MLDWLLSKDLALLVYLNNLGSAAQDGFWIFITSKFSPIPLYIVLLIAVFKKYKSQSWIWLFIIALLILVNDQCSNLFKHGFERLRPCADDEVFPLLREIEYRCRGKFGFYSGHATNAAAIWMFFSHLLNLKGWKYYGLLFWAIIVAISRVYLGVHYPLDILVGFAMGSMWGYVIFRIGQLSFQRLSSAHSQGL